MSVYSFWRVKVPKNGNHLDDIPRRIISKKFCDDEYLDGNPVLNFSHLEWLRGIRDAGIDGLDEIIGEIEAGNSVECWCEH